MQYSTPGKETSVRRWIAVLAAGALIVGGSTVAFAQTDDETSDDRPGFGFQRHEPGQILDDVLAELVSDGTIQQSQADAIVAALDAKRDELLAEREAFRAEREAEREANRAAFEEAWADGKLTRDEIAELPFADRITDPEGPFADALSDGQITQEEWDEIHDGLRFHHGRRGSGGFGGRFGGGFGAPALEDTASA